MSYEEMKKIDVRTIDKETVPELRTLKISSTEDIEVKKQEVLDQLDNVYIHRHGSYLVMNEYGGDISINDLFKSLVHAS